MSIIVPSEEDQFTIAELQEINRRHIALRGSPKLKYFPLKDACKHRCEQDNGEHQCMLEKGHASADHEYSSTCRESPLSLWRKRR